MLPRDFRFFFPRAPGRPFVPVFYGFFFLVFKTLFLRPHIPNPSQVRCGPPEPWPRRPPFFLDIAFLFPPNLF